MQDAYESRFSGLSRLYGREALPRLAAAHVVVVGVGGVGSWTVEALARSGIGRLSLIDLDDVCITNTNRQLPALEETVGRPKTEVLAARCRSIHPGLRVDEIPAFVTPANVAELIPSDASLLIDAIDRTSVKAALLHHCRRTQLPVVTVGGSGGRLDPSRLQIADLAVSGHDMLLRLTRKRLRRAHGWEAGEQHHFGVRTVFSTEPQRFPWSDGSVCDRPEPDSSLRMDCASGVGAACFLTGAVGFLAAAEAVTQIATGQLVLPEPLPEIHPAIPGERAG